MLKRRYIESMWREVAIRHGFEEIDGPRFEHLDLYTIKSGEGIVSELFSFTRAGGEDVYALRPEFTPTLARMAAARASSLPKPVKWFSVGPYFRAERPQRGRLREFLQWNVDIVGDDSPDADAELIACCVDFLRAVGLTPEQVRVKIGDRRAIIALFEHFGVHSESMSEALRLYDDASKISQGELQRRAQAAGLSADVKRFLETGQMRIRVPSTTPGKHDARFLLEQQPQIFIDAISPIIEAIRRFDWADWVTMDSKIVRGLAYYTGAVFEVHEATGKERAIAGGGRYDNLVELFGGPATPAVGFAMGDVVLANVLEDKGLMPSIEQLRDRFGCAPDVFVIPGDGGEVMERVSAVVAALRSGGVHARRSYRATRNVGKLLSEADKAGAHLALIAHGDGGLELKTLRADQRDNAATTNARDRLDKVARAHGWSIEEA